MLEKSFFVNNLREKKRQFSVQIDFLLIVSYFWIYVSFISSIFQRVKIKRLQTKCSMLWNSFLTLPEKKNRVMHGVQIGLLTFSVAFLNLLFILKYLKDRKYMRIQIICPMLEKKSLLNNLHEKIRKYTVLIRIPYHFILFLILLFMYYFNI